VTKKGLVTHVDVYVNVLEVRSEGPGAPLQIPPFTIPVANMSKELKVELWKLVSQAMKACEVEEYTLGEK